MFCRILHSLVSDSSCNQQTLRLILFQKDGPHSLVRAHAIRMSYLSMAKDGELDDDTQRKNEYNSFVLNLGKVGTPREGFGINQV